MNKDHIDEFIKKELNLYEIPNSDSLFGPSGGGGMMYWKKLELNHILRWFNTHGFNYVLTSDGTFIATDDKTPMALNLENLPLKWNLNESDLTKQSDDVYNFLNKLIWILNQE